MKVENKIKKVMYDHSLTYMIELQKLIPEIEDDRFIPLFKTISELETIMETYRNKVINILEQ